MKFTVFNITPYRVTLNLHHTRTEFAANEMCQMNSAFHAACESTSVSRQRLRILFAAVSHFWLLFDCSLVNGFTFIEFAINLVALT
jgi:hypothetical protein